MATHRVTTTTTTCDFCGRDTTKDDPYKVEAKVSVETSNCEGGSTWTETDMCHKCLDLFIKWCKDRKANP